MTITIPIIDNSVLLIVLGIFTVIMAIRLVRWVLDILP